MDKQLENIVVHGCRKTQEFRRIEQTNVNLLQLRNATQDYTSL